MLKQESQYSTLFSCLYDEKEPVGHLGRGTHYSVFRAVEWLDVVRKPIQQPQIHDFAVIWDEDHDIRIINIIQNIYMAGLLSPVQFIGERKGVMTVIVAAKFYYEGTPEIKSYHKQIKEICKNSADGDSWQLEIGMFDRSPYSSPKEPSQTVIHALINAEDHRVVTYLRNIDSLWSLGTKPYTPNSLNSSTVCLFPPAPLNFPKPPVPIPPLPTPPKY